MNKGELIDMVAGDVSCTKREAKAGVESVFENIAGCLAKGDAVRLVG
ncbi:MAG: HU family DNA-binding protein, partial [Actinobacteria bacterium]|nr:HU family DNA-binding protein [Actinomycetota bacterium]